jgi:hypothetical protein
MCVTERHVFHIVEPLVPILGEIGYIVAEFEVLKVCMLIKVWFE